MQRGRGRIIWPRGHTGLEALTSLVQAPLLRHPARKRSGPILNRHTPDPHGWKHWTKCVSVAGDYDEQAQNMISARHLSVIYELFVRTTVELLSEWRRPSDWLHTTALTTTTRVKKHASKPLSISSPSINRFRKFFLRHTLRKIRSTTCQKNILKIGQYVAKISTSLVPFFLGHGVVSLVCCCCYATIRQAAVMCLQLTSLERSTTNGQQQSCMQSCCKRLIDLTILGI